MIRPTIYLLAAALFAACANETNNPQNERGETDTASAPPLVIDEPTDSPEEQLPVGEASSTTAIHNQETNHHSMDASGPPTNVGYTIVPATLSDEEQIILDLTNKERTSGGLSALETDEYLCQLALAHSQNMADGVIDFSHDGFNNRANKVWGKIGGGEIGENCAYNWSGGEQAMDQWMNSTGHRENILNNNFTLIGIGVAVSKDGAYYCTQIFLDK